MSLLKRKEEKTQIISVRVPGSAKGSGSHAASVTHAERMFRNADRIRIAVLREEPPLSRNTISASSACWMFSALRRHTVRGRRAGSGPGALFAANRVDHFFCLIGRNDLVFVAWKNMGGTASRCAWLLASAPGKGPAFRHTPPMSRPR